MERNHKRTYSHCQGNDDNKPLSYKGLLLCEMKIFRKICEPGEHRREGTEQQLNSAK